MSEAEDMRALDGFVEQVCAALDVDVAVVDRDALLALAGRAAHGAVRPAAPVTTYLVGFVVGAAAASGRDTPEAFAEAVARIDAVVSRLLR